MSAAGNFPRFHILIAFVFALLTSTYGLAQDSGIGTEGPTASADASVHTQDGLAYMQAGDYEQALAAFTQVIMLDPTDHEAYTYHAMAYVGLGDYQSAIDDLNTAIELDPTYVTALISRGDIYLLLGDYESAVENYTRAIRLDRQNANAYYWRGIAYWSMGGHHGLTAHSNFTRAIALNETYIDAYLSRGTLRMQQGNYDGALEDLRQGIELAPNYAPLYAALGDLYYAQRLNDQALLAYQTYLTLAGENALPAVYDIIRELEGGSRS